eukprot:4921561-Prymnesium_polylepis.2
MPWDRWAEAYGNVAKTRFWGTIRAVQKFAKDEGVLLHTTWMRPGRRPATPGTKGVGCYAFPAWWFVKERSREADVDGNRTQLMPVPCKDDLAAAADAHFRQNDRAAVLLHSGWSIQTDRWSGQLDHLSPALVAARGLPDEGYDWVHVEVPGNALWDTLNRMWPTLRVGGLLSGAFSGEPTADEYISTKRWQDTYGQVAGPGPSSAPVALRFASAHGVGLRVTWMRPRRRGASCSALAPGRVRDFGRTGETMGLGWTGSCGCRSELPAWYVVKR